MQSLCAAPVQLPPFCLRYNLSAAVVHGHFEVQLQLDCMHLKCLNLQCVDKHFTDGKTLGILYTVNEAMTMTKVNYDGMLTIQGRLFLLNGAII